MNVQGLLTPAQVLCALYNASKPRGMGMMHYIPGDLPLQESENRVSSGTYVDYHRGRVIKADVAQQELNFMLYDRDNGAGAGDRAVNNYLEQLTTPTRGTQKK